MGRMTGIRAGLVLLGITFGAIGALGQPLHAQGFQEGGPHVTGWVDVNLPHHEGTIRVRLVYPAETGGPGSTPDVANGPFPMLFFGHGLGGSSAASMSLLEHMASWGFVVISPDSYTWGPQAFLAQDLMNARSVMVDMAEGTGPFGKMLDPESCGVFGYSMGGGSAVMAGAFDSEFDAVLALSPWDNPDQPAGWSQPSQAASELEVPVLILAGGKDLVTPISDNAETIYLAAKHHAPMAEIGVVPEAGHLVGEDLWEAFTDVGVAFFRSYLLDEHGSLDRVYGFSAQSGDVFDPSFDLLAPECFVVGESMDAGLAVYGAATGNHVVFVIAGLAPSQGIPGLPELGIDLGSMMLLVAGNTPTSNLVVFETGPIPAAVQELLSGVLLQTVTYGLGAGFGFSDVRHLSLDD